MSDNLYELFESRFPADRGRPVMETPAGRIVSYGDLEAASGRYANALAMHGVKKGDRVAVQIDKSPENVFLYLACLRAGAIFLPLNTAYRRAEIDYFLGDAEPQIFVCRPQTEEEAKEIAAGRGVPHVLTLGQKADGTLPAAADGQAETFDTVAADADDIAAILYTSGTTGRSKGAMMSHRNLASNALTLHEIWGFRPDDVLLHALPIYHTHGLFVAINCTLLNGTPMLFLEKFDADTVIDLMPRATAMMGVPTFYVRLLASPRFTADVAKHMRLFISGSAPLLAETFDEFESRTGHRILERYGMTETGMNTSNPLDGERIAGTVGPPLPDVQARVCDDQGNILGTDEIGVLEVKGPNVFKGYWRMPEKTAEEFRADGFFITGDLAKIDANGYVHIVGRAKDLIISGGFNVYPKEIEGYIDELPGVGESAVIGLPHPDFGEAVAAVVTARDGALDEDNVIGPLKDSLAAFKVPKRVFVVDELPRNSMGKVQKNVLRDTYKDTFKAG